MRYQPPLLMVTDLFSLKSRGIKHALKPIVSYVSFFWYLSTRWGKEPEKAGWNSKKEISSSYFWSIFLANHLHLGKGPILLNEISASATYGYKPLFSCIQRNQTCFETFCKLYLIFLIFRHSLGKRARKSWVKFKKGNQLFPEPFSCKSSSFRQRAYSVKWDISLCYLWFITIILLHPEESNMLWNLL